jgi:hypothetical protein
MADTKITALTAITTVDPAVDVLPIVDVSDTTMAASGTTKKITSNQILGAGGTATLASATITGDLTVRTNKLLVTSTGVGVGMTPITPLSGVIGTTGAVFFRTTDPAAPVATPYIQAPVSTGFSSTAAAYGFWYQDCGISNPAVGAVGIVSGSSERYRIAADGVATWSNVGGVAGTAMTLNSTGLGVGVTPGTKFDVGLTGAGTPRIRFTSASDNPILEFQRYSGVASDYYGERILTGGGFYFQTAPAAAVGSQTFTTRFTIDSSGNVGVGVTPSAWQSGLKAIQFAANGVLYGNGTNSAFFGNNYYTDSGGTNRYIVSNAALAYGQTAGAHQWFIAPAGTAGNAITFTQAMTLTASGELLVGTTSQIRGGKLSVDSSAGVASGLKSSAGSSVFVEELWNTGSLDNSFINFGTDSTFTARGSITYNRSGGLVAYNTTSDYRAKDIIGPVSNSGSVIDSLKVYIGKMKGASVERPMLVAHEAQIVAPYSVTGQKDEVDADGNPKYQQMDVSSFVPLLIAEIQSLRTRVQTLEAR